MKRRTLLPISVPLLACLIMAGPAHAEERGVLGKVTELHINTPGSEAHALYHGAITLEMVGGATLTEYRWGGSSCPGVRLTDQQIDLLMTALVQQTRLTPKYTRGEAGTRSRCLVGFVLSAERGPAPE